MPKEVPSRDVNEIVEAERLTSMSELMLGVAYLPRIDDVDDWQTLRELGHEGKVRKNNSMDWFEGERSEGRSGSCGFCNLPR
jgi:hypothetical protein